MSFVFGVMGVISFIGALSETQSDSFRLDRAIIMWLATAVFCGLALAGATA